MEKKNTGLIVLIIVLSLLVLGLGGYIVYDKVLSKEGVSTDVQDVDDNGLDVQEENSIELNKDTFADKLNGSYVACEMTEDANMCVGRVVSIENDSISICKLHSSGCIRGDLKNVEYINENIYKVSFVMLKGDGNDVSGVASEDTEYYVYFDISKYDENKIITYDLFNVTANASIEEKKYELEKIGNGKCDFDKYLASKEGYESQCSE